LSNSFDLDDTFTSWFDDSNIPEIGLSGMFICLDPTSEFALDIQQSPQQRVAAVECDRL
jgi:hypothetical protein